MYSKIHWFSTVVLPLITSLVANMAGRQGNLKMKGDFEQPIVLVYLFAQLTFLFVHLICWAAYSGRGE